jgi:hypothetical protein
VKKLPMRFPKSKAKLDEARNLVMGLDSARDSVTYRAHFLSAINAERAVTMALQQEGAHVPGFEVWYEPWQHEMKADELLRFIHEARIEDFHRGGGKDLLVFPRFDLKRLKLPDDLEPPPVPTADLRITSEGPIWIVNRDQPDEYRVAAVPRGGAEGRMAVMLAHPPRTHRGQALTRGSPSAVLKLALGYLQGLVTEAERFFGS